MIKRGRKSFGIDWFLSSFHSHWIKPKNQLFALNKTSTGMLALSIQFSILGYKGSQTLNIMICEIQCQIVFDYLSFWKNSFEKNVCFCLNRVSFSHFIKVLFQKGFKTAIWISLFITSGVNSIIKWTFIEFSVFTLLGTLGDINMPKEVWTIQGSKILLYIHIT